MEPRDLATQLAAGRIVIGTALSAFPQLTSAWVGSGEGSSTAARVLAPAMGVRDLALGVGSLLAVRRGSGARPWLLANAASDAVDLAATLRNRGEMPFLGVVGVAFMATTSAALNAWLATALD